MNSQWKLEVAYGLLDHCTWQLDPFILLIRTMNHSKAQDHVQVRWAFIHLKSWTVVIRSNLKTDSEFSEQTGTFGPLGLVSSFQNVKLCLWWRSSPATFWKPDSMQFNIKSCSRFFHSFWRVFNSQFKVYEKLEFARTAQFSPVFDSDFLLFTTARTMSYISNESSDFELSFDIKFFWFWPRNVMNASDRMHARALRCENSFLAAASIRCHWWLRFVQKVWSLFWCIVDTSFVEKFCVLGHRLHSDFPSLCSFSASDRATRYTIRKSVQISTFQYLKWRIVVGKVLNVWNEIV